MRFPAWLAGLCVAAAALPAQLPRPDVPELRYEPELTIDLANHQMHYFQIINVSPRGSFIVRHQSRPPSVVVFDSVGAKTVWPLEISSRNADIGWVYGSGWVGDTLWIADRNFDQLALIDSTGKLIKSIEYPSWVRPFWRDRRKYPLFRALEWHAVYRDSTALVMPSSPRAIFDTPEYDRSKAYLLRVDMDGKVLKTVAMLPAGPLGLLLRDGTEKTSIMNPFMAKTAWHVSENGERIAIVAPLKTASDSGAFMVTALDANGDTVFARRYTVPTTRTPPDAIEKYLAGIKPFGRHTAEWIRDTLRKQIPVFESRVPTVRVGMDNSIWVWLRTDRPEKRALIIDATGNAVGTVSFPPSMSIFAMTKDRAWTSHRDGPSRTNAPVKLMRMRLTPATTARPSRSASASTSLPR
jgi:hypothetical protein